ncbi:serine/threonine-protein kinase [Nocardioides halotolerans]|uniref:serine/threonine-protein kinase n=1 Tax=Nocardioides halotolerans TaxID=433660 RepID=UPI0004005557|nr:serine/threonine-protein kinase [Nocardioides halotolerans]
MTTDERPPDLLVAGRYRVESRLGRGGMADVVAAHDTVLDRRVAIKLLREAPESDVARARFVSEARILAGMSNPGLVTVLDAGITGDHPYLVMELLPGGTVADLVDRGAQPLDRVAEIGAQVATALAPVHATGVVHRDIKPGNLLLDGQGRVRLADFGIARLVGDTVRVTATGTTIGTATYLAPEQASGGEVGTPADIYALGLVLLELITGRPAFGGTPTEAALARLTHDPVVPDHLPDRFGDLLRAMTSRDPALRPTAAAVAAGLAPLSRTLGAARAAQADIETEATALVTPPVPWWQRRGLRAGALVGAAAVIALGLSLGLPYAEAPATTHALRTPASSNGPVLPAEAPAAAATPGAQPAAATQPRPHRPTRAKHHRKAHKPKHHKSKHHKSKHHKPKHHKPGHDKNQHHKPPKHHGHH